MNKEKVKVALLVQSLFLCAFILFSFAHYIIVDDISLKNGHLNSSTYLKKCTFYLKS